MPTKKQLFKLWEQEFEFFYRDEDGNVKPKNFKEMSIQEKINADLKSAILSKNEITKSILRVLIGELNRVDKVAVDGVFSNTVSDDKIISIIKKMIENAKVVNNLHEVTILEKYLPNQLSDLELKNVITNIASTNSYTVKDLGKVMSYLKENFSGLYDGKLASTLAKEILG